MFASRIVHIAVSLIAVSAFSPSRMISQSRSELKMTAEQPSLSKTLSVAVLAASMFSMPVLAKEGAGAKFDFFGDAPSSPFTVNENREDKIYSPYSPYGDGTAAAYNSRKGTKEETAFWKTTLDKSIARTKNIPAIAEKKKWQAVRTELTSYAYNLRESVRRAAEGAKDPAAASAAGKAYVQDLEDVYYQSEKKNLDALKAAYAKSEQDLATFLKTIQ